MKAKTAFWTLVCLVLAGCGGRTIYEVYDNAGWENDEMCKQNIKSLSNALHIYASDYDDRFPLANWGESLPFYIRNPRLQTCPTLYTPGTTNSGYSLNPDVFGLERTTVDRPDLLVTFFESGSTTWGEPSEYPQDSIHSSRHAGSIYLVYLDGRIEDTEDKQ